MALPLPTDKLWMIEATSLPSIMQAVRAANGRLRGVNRAPARLRGQTAIIDVVGPLTKHATFLTELFGIASTNQIREAVNAAARDERIREIILHIESPGGSTSGIDDLASDVRAAAARKPVTAYIEDIGASAAYYVASQATKVYANRNALVGSIGTMLVLYDFSKLFNSAGIETHLIRSGKFKGIGVIGSKIETEQLALLQEEINAINSLFIDTVARGRRMTTKRVAELATGEVWVGQQAVALGLIDGIGRFDEASLAKSSNDVARSEKPAAAPKPAALVTTGGPGITFSGPPEWQRQAAAPPKPTTPPPPPDYIAQWNEAVEAQQQHGLTRLAAIKAVEKERPGLRLKMLDAQRSRRR